MKTYTEKQLAALLSAAYLFGLEDGIQMPQLGAAAAKETARMIRDYAPYRVTNRVLSMLDADAGARSAARGPEDAHD